MEDKQLEVPDHFDPLIQMINFNMQYLVNNNFYREKLDKLESELKDTKNKNYDLIDQISDLRQDYSTLLRKYRKSNPPKIYKESNKRKLNEIVQPNSFKKRRKSKNSLSDEEINRIFFNINNINDIIELEKHGKKIYHNPKLIKLINIIPPLKKLQNMVGLDDVKSAIFNHILYFIQDLNKDEMYHTVISGPPGVGKTELGKILGSIYLGLGILKSDKFRVVKRSELIGKYLGHTAAQTQEIIDDCKGGVMFIDEAYSLGNDNNGDSYSKEALDTINSYLSENKRDIICIIAGYKDELKKCFFNQNKGLERRFPWKYTIEKYNDEELFKIFKYIVENNEWKIDNTIDKSFFKKNYDKFKNNGGDCEILFHKSKLIYSKNYVNNKKRKYKLLNIEDLNNSIDIFDSKSKHKDNYNYMYS